MAIDASLQTLDDLLIRIPSLTQARTQIRSKFEAKYLQEMDGFEGACFRNLPHAYAAEQLFGTDLLIGTDIIFEASDSLADLNEFMNEMISLTDLSQARVLAAQTIAGDAPFKEVIKHLFADLLVFGYGQLEGVTTQPMLPDLWLGIYNQCFGQYMRQQVDSNSQQHLWNCPTCPTMCDVDAISLFLNRFSYTSGFSISTLGIFSCLAAPSPIVLLSLVELTDKIDRLYRFALDLAYDPTEKFNLPIYVLGHQNGITYPEAGALLASDAALRQALYTRLADRFEQHVTETQQAIDRIIARFEGSSDYDALRQFCFDAVNLGRSLAKAWKPNTVEIG